MYAYNAANPRLAYSADAVRRFIDFLEEDSRVVYVAIFHKLDKNKNIIGKEVRLKCEHDGTVQKLVFKVNGSRIYDS